MAPGKAHLAPTTDDEVESKLDGCWAGIKKRASDAARKQLLSSATGQEGQPPLKRFCTPSTAATKPRFASLARSRVRGDTEDGGEVDSEDQVLIKQVTAELERYQALYIKPEEVCF